MKDSASTQNTQNTIVAFYREYSRYRYLYFTTGKQWIKDLLSDKEIAISQHTCMARARGKGIDRIYVTCHLGDRSLNIN